MHQLILYSLELNEVRLCGLHVCKSAPKSLHVEPGEAPVSDAWQSSEGTQVTVRRGHSGDSQVRALVWRSGEGTRVTVSRGHSGDSQPRALEWQSGERALVWQSCEGTRVTVHARALWLMCCVTNWHNSPETDHLDKFTRKYHRCICVFLWLNLSFCYKKQNTIQRELLPLVKEYSI